MTIPLDTATPRGWPLDASRPVSNVWPWIVVALLFVAAIGLRYLVAANTDVSWLLTAAEKLLDGKQLYRDIIETNPPMAVLIYVPALLLARATGLPAEAVVDGLVFFGIALSLAMTAALLRHSDMVDAKVRWPLTLSGLALLAILPTQTFAQREHIVVIELLPAIALFALRAKGHAPPRWGVIAGGIGMGLALSFKPYFAVAIFFGIAAAMFHTRSWRLLLAPENIIGGAIVVGYAVITAVIFPDYFATIVPLVRDVYMPIGPSLIEVAQKPVMLLWAVTMSAAVLAGRRGAADATQLLLLALSVGFAIVFLLQRKGWPYHSYPMMVFALLALFHAISANNTPPHGRRIVKLGLLAVSLGLFLQAMLWFDRAFDARILQPHVARLGSYPVVLAISGEPGLGHPLTRALGGHWVSRQQAIWVTHYRDYARRTGQMELETAAMIERYAARERQWLADDIRKTPPTVVLIDNMTGDWGAWLQAHPQIGGLLKDYRKVDSVMGVDLLVRVGS